ncbi:tumor suppressor, Mitostatin-domain-containing protein [Cladochytrium replicatum]|nr:tumor suppressor, Mitostatin-domain-containing protein [Cladochytrium replicatum]
MDQINKLGKDRLHRVGLQSDNRVECLRRLNDDRARKEDAEDERIRKERERVHQAKLEEEQREALVNEIERRQLEELREEKLRQAIRENSVELRELERKLDYAYMNKSRALQIQQRALSAMEEQQREARLIAEMNAQLEQARLAEIQKEEETYVRSRQYKRALQDQLEETEARKQAEWEQFLKEKAMVDEIVRKIAEEDEREVLQRLEKQRETKQYIEEFIREREAWRAQEAERLQKENEKIESYARSQQQREDEKAAKKADVDNERNLIYDKLAAEMERKERESRELEQLRVELYQEEEEERARRRDQELLESRIRKRLEMIAAYRSQIAEKRNRALQAREDEEKFRHKMMQKFAEDEKIEQLNAQKRRMKQIEHKRAVDALIEERRAIARRAAEREAERTRREKDLEMYRQQVIEQERQRLLREHAEQLLGYLPKGVLRDQADLDMFDEEFRRRFESKLAKDSD